MKVLIPVDGSDYTKRCLSYLAAHDELLAGSHDFVAVTVAPGIPEEATRFLDRSTVHDYYAERAEHVMAPVRAFAQMQHWALRERVAHGHAAEQIALAVEQEKPDLIVMGSRGHSSLGGLLLGSVAVGVMSRCKQPLLLIR